MDVSLASIKASDLGLITAASAAIPSTGPGDPGTPATPATPKILQVLMMQKQR